MALENPTTPEEIDAWNKRRWEKLTPIERLEDVAEILWLAMSPMERYAMSRKVPLMFGPWERGVRREGGLWNYWCRQASINADSLQFSFYAGEWCWVVWYGGGAVKETGTAPTAELAAKAAEDFWRSKNGAYESDDPVCFVGDFPTDLTLNEDPDVLGVPKNTPQAAGPWTLEIKGRCLHWLRYFTNGDVAAQAWWVPEPKSTLWQYEAKQLNPEAGSHRSKYTLVNDGAEQSPEAAMARCDAALKSTGCQLTGDIPTITEGYPR